jgi:CBS domain-containing protein
MNVESILERKGTEVATIAPEASIKRAADWLRAKNVGALVVTSNDATLGIISERDIVRAFSQYGEPKGHHDARLDHRVPRG